MALITVATEEGDSFPVDVSLDISLEDLCALLEADVSSFHTSSRGTR